MNRSSLAARGLCATLATALVWLPAVSYVPHARADEPAPEARAASPREGAASIPS